MVLLGQDMEIVAFTPKQLRQFPTFSPSGTTDVPDDTIIKSVSRSPLINDRKAEIRADCH